MATDLRMLTAILHANIHVERLGDYETTAAKLADAASDLDHHPDLARALVDMGTAATHVSRSALRSFAHRDLDAAQKLPLLDDRVDQLNLDIFRRLVRLAAVDERCIEWANHMVVVARSLERYGDHAVDIGEQTVFVVTGETVELSSNDPQLLA